MNLKTNYENLSIAKEIANDLLNEWAFNSAIRTKLNNLSSRIEKEAEWKMTIISSYKDNITESVEFSIKQRETCRNEFITEKVYKNFKKKINKKDDYISQKELSQLYKNDMIKKIYKIFEVKSGRVFGMYLTKERAKKELQDLFESVGNCTKYQFKIDKDIGLTAE